MNESDLDAFWKRAIACGAVPIGTPLPASVEAFGDSPEMADELAELIATGPKRATASAHADYELEGETMPYVGGLSVVLDGSERARAVIRTTDVRVGPLSSVDEGFAWEEGEGDRTRASWLDDHIRFFRRRLADIGVEYDPDMATVFERFELLYAE